MHTPTNVVNGILVQAVDHATAVVGQLSVLHRHIGYTDNELAHTRTIERTEATMLPSTLPVLSKMFRGFQRVSDVRSTASWKAQRVIVFRNTAPGFELQASIRVYSDRVLLSFSK